MTYTQPNLTSECLKIRANKVLTSSDVACIEKMRAELSLNVSGICGQVSLWANTHATHSYLADANGPIGQKRRLAAALDRSHLRWWGALLELDAAQYVGALQAHCGRSRSHPSSVEACVSSPSLASGGRHANAERLRLGTVVLVDLGVLWCGIR